jgi:hypothetical protein
LDACDGEGFTDEFRRIVGAYVRLAGDAEATDVVGRSLHPFHFITVAVTLSKR